MSKLVEIANWACSLKADEIPEDVRELARAQRKSVLGAIAASSSDEGWRRVLESVEAWATDGPAALVGTRRNVSVDDALYCSAAASVALDFDDYLCFGHTGHSAVLVPLIMERETGSDAQSQLVAQLAANEVEGRLGGACLIGPQNGQLWSHIHSAGSALAGGLLMGLGPEQLAHSMAISLYQAPRATVAGFMSPDSKLLTASEPILMGLRSARLAARGVTGPLDALDAPSGFLAAFADRPLKGLLGGLGEEWATRTLCVKPYPGCAYLDTMLDSLHDIGSAHQVEAEHGPRSHDAESVLRAGDAGGVLRAGDVESVLRAGDAGGVGVERVVVEAGVLTCAMDAMSGPYAAHRPPTPVTVNFSVSLNVAIFLLAGEVTPRQCNATWLAEHQSELADMVAKVQLHHDWAMTLRSAGSVASLLPPRALARDVGLSGIGDVLHRVRSQALAARPVSPRAVSPRATPARSVRSKLEALAEVVAPAKRIGSIASVGRSLLGARQPALAEAWKRARYWEPGAASSFEMCFPARVTVVTRDGRRLAAEAAVPRGGAGNSIDGPCDVARRKLLEWGPLLWGADGAGELDLAVDADAADLWRMVGDLQEA